MADEPSLPVLPGVSWDERSQSFSKGPRKRIRPLQSGSGNALMGLHNSSDPAIFSSDDDPGLDNYVSSRRKRKYVGSWYNQLPASGDSTFSESIQLPRPKRTLRRQLDSGVFLGSDGTDNDEIPEILELPLHSKVPRFERPAVPTLPETERLAQDKIRECLEQGNESIDFWSMGLEELSNETVAPLSQLQLIPQVTRDVAFEQKEPELKIYLARNRLARLPGALFDLSHLTVLSLRDNKLTELPTAIAKLTNLRELNVAQNKLRQLPAQLLSLLRPSAKLKKLTLFPNPFVQPDRSIGDISEDNEMTALEYSATMPTGPRKPSHVARFLGRSPVQLTTSHGRIISKFVLSMDGGRVRVHVSRGECDDATDDKFRDEPAAKQSKVPSLLEAALKACYNTSKPELLPEYIPDELYQIRGLLDRAARQKYSGGIACSTCQRLMVMPAVQWVEWRDIRSCQWQKSAAIEGELSAKLVPLSTSADEISIPFLRQACSWPCGPVGKEVDMGWAQGFDVRVTKT